MPNPDTVTIATAPLIRGIRRWDLVALMINAIVGAGIFGLPSTVFVLTNTYSLFAYLLCAVLIILIVLCFAELTGRFADTGGPYLYAREAFGGVTGFEVGWLLWLARPTAFAALCNLFVGYLAFFWPAASTGAPRVVVITAIVVVLTTINIAGVRTAALWTDVFTVAKLIPLLLFVAIGVFYVDPQNFSLQEQPDADSFSMAVLLLVFAFSGFEMPTVSAGETKDPQRQMPFALFTAIAVVAVLYVLIQFVCIGTLPGLAQSQRPLADASRRFIGPAGAAMMSIGALVSIFGTLNTITLAGPRILFAMGERKQLPAFFAATHRRFHTPHAAILVSAATMLVLSLAGTFISALTISTIIRLITYVTSCAAVLVLRRKKGLPAGFVVPGATVVVVAALILCAWLLSNTAWNEIRTAGLAVLVGLIFWRMARRGP